MKTCFKCGREKPLDEFYKHAQMADGHLNKCKDCAKADVRANRSVNLRYYREYDRSRGTLPHRKAQCRQYQHQNPEVHSIAIERWEKKYPERKRASTAVNNAIRDGRLFKCPCEVCGTELDVEGHHDDYSKPLEVRWLCDKHHKEHHKMLRELERLAAV